MTWWGWVVVVLAGWVLVSAAFGIIWIALHEWGYRRRAQAQRRGNVR